MLGVKLNVFVSIKYPVKRYLYLLGYRLGYKLQEQRRYLMKFIETRTNKKLAESIDLISFTPCAPVAQLD